MDSTLDFTNFLAESRDKVNVILETMINQSQISLGIAGEVGRTMVPNDEGVQLLMVSFQYSEQAHKNRDNHRGLWQYATALLAARKSDEDKMWGIYMESLQKDYPNLDSGTLEYLTNLR